MTYYRMALQERQSSTWTWKSTVLTSLDALLRLLRIYSAIPQERIRVFTASSKDDMDEMLGRENIGLASGRVRTGNGRARDPAIDCHRHRFALARE